MKKSLIIYLTVLIIAAAAVTAVLLRYSVDPLTNGRDAATTKNTTIRNYSGYYTTVSAATSVTETEPSVAYQRTLTVQPGENYVKPVGRTVFYGGTRWMSMSGSGIEFKCKGEAVSITLMTDEIGVSYSHRPRVAVIADDFLVFDGCLESGETVVNVDLALHGRDAVISVVKLSESMYSSCGIGKITVHGEGEITPTPEKQLKLEFIGDSITCGFGIDEPNRYARFSTQTENFAKSYAYLASKMLDADYSAVAFSGYGVLSGYTTNGVSRPEAVIFERYERAITNKSIAGTVAAVEWDFTSYVPDMVVINLGTNDALYCSTSERRNDFVAEYKRLIELVRSKYPEAYILCILGDMNNSLYPSIETAVSEYTSATFDNKVSCAAVDFKMGENDIVISGHPGEKSNLTAAHDLAEIIRGLGY